MPLRKSNMSRLAKSSTMVLSRASRSLYFLFLAGGPWAQSSLNCMLLSSVIYYIYPANCTIETVYFVQLAVSCKAGLLQFRVAFKSSAFTQPKWIFIPVKLTEMKIAGNSISLRCAHVNTSIVCRLNRYEFFCLRAK